MSGFRLVRSGGESISLSQAVDVSLEEESALLSYKEKSTAAGHIVRLLFAID